MKAIEEMKTQIRSGAESCAIASDLEFDPEFVAMYTRAKTVEDILEAMEEAGMTKNDLAKALGKSRQYVGAILNETANFTIDTMSAISCAIGRRLAIRMVRPDERLEVVKIQSGSSITAQLIPVNSLIVGSVNLKVTENDSTIPATA